MGLLRTYGFLNAKVRAMRSFLLTGKQYQTLANTADFRDLLQHLSQSGYESVVEEAGTRDPERLERALQAEELHRLRAIYNKSGRPVSRILYQILQRHEAERLKWVLRLWYQKRGEPDRFLRDPDLYPLPVHEILDAPALEDVLRLLEGHPFYPALTGARTEFEAKQTLFPLELAIDREQIRRFLERVRKLNRRDRRICHELIGMEIDLKNLNWIERFRHYYGLGSADILTRLLPGGLRLGSEQLRKIVVEGNPISVFTTWDKEIQTPPPESKESKFMLQSLEIFLAHALQRRASRAFAEFPFSIGAVLGYSLLLRIEMMNLRTLIQGKIYQLNADAIQSRLVY